MVIDSNPEIFDFGPCSLVTELFCLFGALLKFSETVSLLAIIIIVPGP